MIVVSALLFQICNKGKEIYIKKVSTKQINAYLNRTSTSINENEEISANQKERYEYIAILEIPDINLLQGLLAETNKYNNVEYNIEIIDGSKMPNIPNTNLVLASHSGTSNISYFKNLENLRINSEVYIYYNGYKYIYRIDNYLVLPKTGTITIDRDKYQNTITLVTCKKDSDDEQIVYIGYLTSKEIY